MPDADYDRRCQPERDVAIYDPMLPARFDGIHSCAACKPLVTALGWRWLIASIRERRSRRRAAASGRFMPSAPPRSGP